MNDRLVNILGATILILSIIAMINNWSLISLFILCITTFEYATRLPLWREESIDLYRVELLVGLLSFVFLYMVISDTQYGLIVDRIVGILAIFSAWNLLNILQEK